MKRFSLLIHSLPVFVALLVVPVAHAQEEIFLDLRSDPGIGRTLELLAESNPESAFVSAMQDGITFSANATSSLTNDDGDTPVPFFNRQTNFNANGNAGGSGVDSGLRGGSSTGDLSSTGIDPGEDLTFTLEFADDLPRLFLTSINLSGISDSITVISPESPDNTIESDAATITIGNRSAITVFNTVESDEFTFNGADIFTPNTPIEIVSGDTISFSNPGTNAFRINYSVESITLSTGVAAVPEPSSLTLLSLGGMWMMVRRKRS